MGARHSHRKQFEGTGVTVSSGAHVEILPIAELVIYGSKARTGRMRYCVAKANITAIKMTRRDVRIPEAISSKIETSVMEEDKPTHIVSWCVSERPQYARYYLR